MKFKDIPNILNDFLNYLILKNYAKGTIQMYKEDLKDFLYFLKFNKKLKSPITKFSIIIFSNITESDVSSYLYFLNDIKENSTTTRYRKYCAIRCFFHWLTKTFPAISNPIDGLLLPKNIVRLPKYLTLEQAKKIQNIFNTTNSKYPLRNNTIITLFLATGIRISELVNINLEDINFNNNTILIKHGKGNKSRTVYFSDSCKKQLLKYLHSKKETIVNLNCPLFISYRNERLKIGAVREICKNAYKLIGVEGKHFTPHSLRHTSATLMYKFSKKDILLVKEFLGHNSIVSTQIYAHTDNDIIREAVEKNPLSNFIPSNEKVA